MRKFTLVTLLAVIISQVSFSQKIYLPGYVISFNGDTLHGFIDYWNRELNPGKIYFKENMDVRRTEYGPLNCKAFRVGDEFYVSAIVETEISPVDSRQLEHGPELKLRTDTTFLQTMISGKKNIYFYMNKFGNEQFYIRKDTSFELLIRKKYLKEANNQTLILENKKYIGQLALYLKDCPTIQKQLEKTEYWKKSMEELFLYYYDCISTGIKVQKKTEKPHVEFGVLAGLTLTKLKFRGDAYPSLSNTVYPLSVSFSGGVFLNIIFPRNNGKWSICNELMYSSYKVDGQTDNISATKHYVVSTTIGYSYLQINSMLRFKYPIGPLSLFINAGFTNGFALYEKNYKRTEYTFNTFVSVDEGEAIASTRKWELGALGGIGLMFKRFSFEVRYEWGNGMSDLPLLRSTTSRYHFLFGFRI